MYLPLYGRFHTRVWQSKENVTALLHRLPWHLGEQTQLISTYIYIGSYMSFHFDINFYEMSLSNDIEQASWGVYIVSRFISFPGLYRFQVYIVSGTNLIQVSIKMITSKFFFLSCHFSVRMDPVCTDPVCTDPTLDTLSTGFLHVMSKVILDLYSITILEMVILHGKQG